MDPTSEKVKKVGKFRYIDKKKVSAGFFSTSAGVPSRSSTSRFGREKNSRSLFYGI
jgi:hypothetical protein